MSKFLVRVRNLACRDEQGASLVEYGLLVGLIALAAVTGITLVGGGISTMFTGIGNYLSGLPLP